MLVTEIIKKPLVSTKAKIVNIITKWQVFVPGLLMAGYIIGLVAAFQGRDSVSVATVHQGPYAFLGMYKGNLYELIPMEEAVRLHQLQRMKLQLRGSEHVLARVE